MNQTEAAATLNAVLAQQKKTEGEILTVQTEVGTLKTKITDLEGLLASGGEVTAELAAAVQAVKEQAQVVDDAIPDVPAPEPTPEPA